MDLIKVAGVQDCPMPTMVKGVRSFLGFCRVLQLLLHLCTGLFGAGPAPQCPNEEGTGIPVGYY